MYEDILDPISAASHKAGANARNCRRHGRRGSPKSTSRLSTWRTGPAGAELFSRVGKADIAVTIGDGHVFIAECKIWGGQKKFTDAVDQLLSYLVWGDSKARVGPIHQARAAHRDHRQGRCRRRAPPAVRRADRAQGADSRIDYQLRSTADEQTLIRTAPLPVVIAGRRTEGT